ncbi:sugar ABC transporter substrate-binding protein [Clostridiaceae bacterium Marseille-Q4145]|nr:sugar ABC transporter substrate-binding protein [Clostridiaceae bacterium Marseille-Q4145]
MKKLKKITAFLLALTMVLAMTSCAKKTEETHIHKIGVLVYDLKDEQVQAFREYMEGYIGENFSDVDFLYSAGVTTDAEEMEFLNNAIAAGVEGIIAFNSFDIEKEVSLCASHGVYYLRPSSTTDPEDFAKVEDNPYFLGYFGPGNEMEYEAGYDMGAYFAKEQISDSYFLLSGGAGTNVMHEQRAEGMLDALQEAYGVQFDQSSMELASASEPVSVEAGTLKVTVFPGYIGVPDVGEKAVAAFEKEPAGVVMSTIPVQAIADSLGDASLGTVDCYTETNGELFKNGHLKYLCGKYESIIGPAFAAMYNAVTGYSEDFREDGKAFAIQQGFWTSTDYQDFQEKYELSSGITLNAYSYEDLLEVCKAHNPNATLNDLKELAGAWDFDSAVQRRK